MASFYIFSSSFFNMQLSSSARKVSRMPAYLLPLAIAHDISIVTKFLTGNNLHSCSCSPAVAIKWISLCGGGVTCSGVASGALTEGAVVCALPSIGLCVCVVTGGDKRERRKNAQRPAARKSVVPTVTLYFARTFFPSSKSVTPAAAHT